MRMNVMNARWHMLEQVVWEMAGVFKVEVWRIKRRVQAHQVVVISGLDIDQALQVKYLVLVIESAPRLRSFSMRPAA